MAFSDPQATQDPQARVNKGSAALLNVWRDDMDFLRNPSTAAGAVVTRATDQTLTGDTTINWTSETQDVGAMHDNATNNERLTVPSGQAGLYLVGVNARSLTATSITVTMLKNAATVIAQKARSSNSGQHAISIVAPLQNLIVGDYIWCKVNGGTALDADVGLRVSLWAQWMGGPK